MRRIKAAKRFRKKKSILRNRFFLGGILVFISVILFSYFLFFSFLFKIGKIQIIAEKNSCAKNIQVILNQEIQAKFLYFFRRNNFFLIRDGKMKEEILSDCPGIEEVKFEKKFPKTLILSIKEKTPAGIYCFAESKCFLIDSKGVAFKRQAFSVKAKNNLMLISVKNPEEKRKDKIGKKIIPKKEMDKLLLVKNALEEKFKIRVKSVLLADKGRMDMETEEGWKIYFNLSSNLDLAIAKLGLLLNKELPLEKRKNLKYIDLRFSLAYYQ